MVRMIGLQDAASQKPEVEAFLDKFLLGDEDANTSVTKHSFEGVEFEHWYDGWLTGKSSFPEPDTANVESIFYEVERATHGADWNVVEDPNASNGQYLTIKSGLNSSDAAPTKNEVCSSQRIAYSRLGLGATGQHEVDSRRTQPHIGLS